MAGNEWINGYLEAILDAGAGGAGGGGGGAAGNSVGDRKKNFILSPKETLQKSGAGFEFSPTKYFVEEVINSFEETDLHRTWIKVIATRNTRERNNRLENMCWRIWHLARKKKQIAWDDARRLAKRRLEREQSRHDAAADLSELSEGEKEKGDSNQAESLPRSFSRINSDLQIWSEDSNQAKRLYIVLMSLHGLVRGENMELGRDSDTGGQVKYVVELAKALAATKGVHRVDLLTRQISSPDVDWSYGEPIEMLSSSPSSSSSSDAGDTCGAAYIIRLPCGPPERYIPKESLWPYIPEFVDRALAHVAGVARALGGELDHQKGGKPNWPYVVHGHYADAGEAAALLSGILNVPMVLTGHSLGRNKFEQLLKQGRLSREDINATYKIVRRIEAEEMGLDAAEMVVTSTRQEVEEQWGLYDGFDVKLERKLRARRRRGVSCLGRYMPRMVVIPPGMDFSSVTPHDSDAAAGDGDLGALIGRDRAQGNKTNLPPIWSEVMRFFTNPHKPMILALSRPDPKKNVTTLLKAFGECRPLRELANLTLILGNRDDIEEMPAGTSTVLTAVLKLIDRYDLYGHVAYPKHHKQSDVPHIYRLAAKTKGVFINPALVEPFGLTLIEATAYGLPTVATKNGGPVDIHKALNNGLLVDPHDQKAIADALLKLVADKNMWLECRKSGLKNIHRFSWPEHCRNYLSHVEHCRSRHPAASGAGALGVLPAAAADEEPMSDSLKDVDDLSIKFSVDIDVMMIKSGDAALDAVARQKAVIDALARPSAHVIIPNSTRARLGPGRRRRLFVVAADCYRSDGAADLAALRSIVSGVLTTASSSGAPGATGCVYLTGSTLGETLQTLRGCDIPVEEFDAVVCCSGSEVYYPWRDLTADAEYGVQIEYKWPGENVQSVIPRLATKTDAGAGEDDVLGDAAASSSRCYAYSVKPGGKVRRIDDIRQRLRMRGFRCNPVYVRAATRLNVVPLFASRAKALRYLSIRWGIDVSSMVVFVSEKGDTDHEELLVGLNKTVVVTDAGEDAVGSSDLLRGSESYRREDVVPVDNPNLFRIPLGFQVDDVSKVLQTVGMD